MTFKLLKAGIMVLIVRYSLKIFFIRCPIGDYPFYMLIETSGSNERHDAEKLNYFLEKQMSTDTILDGVIVSEPSKINVI